MKVMFICTGNICRSAMADGLMKVYIEKEEELKNKVKVFSCGIFAEDGDMPTFNAIEAIKEYGVNLKEHRATNIRNSNIEQMDLILCATKSHKQSVIQMYPELRDRVYTMKEYAGYEERNLDIRDPWGYDIEVYRFCASEIEDCIRKTILKIKQ